MKKNLLLAILVLFSAMCLLTACANSGGSNANDGYLDSATGNKNTFLGVGFFGEIKEVSTLDIDFNLIYVPAGSFRLDKRGEEFSIAEKIITMFLSQGFWMGETEVTQKLWKTIMGNNPSAFTTNPDGGDDDLLPVERVNWYDAITFCNKLSIASGLNPVYHVDGVDFITLHTGQVPTVRNTYWEKATADFTMNGYRLPTEMEAMWAAMGADADAPEQCNEEGYKKSFPGSDGSNNVGEFVWHHGNAEGKTHEVALKEPNELGLYDMSGNVYEWCWDWYSGEYYEMYDDDTVDAYTDYIAFDPANGGRIITRGGSWEFYTAKRSEIYIRAQYQAASKNSGVGLRVVRP